MKESTKKHIDVMDRIIEIYENELKVYEKEIKRLINLIEMYKKKDISQYEKDWIGLNLLNYDRYTWFKHDCNIRLNDLTNLIFGEKKKEINDYWIYHPIECD